MTSNRNSCLNVIKALACIGVVFIHFAFPGNIGIAIKYMSAYAVPVFFMISGYYSCGCTKEKLKTKLIKILKLLLFGYILFFLCDCAAQINNGTLLSWIASNYTYKTLIKYILFCTIDFAIPLWYLIAIAETYLCFIVFEKKLNNLNLYALMFVLIAIKTVLTIARETLQIDWFWETNFLFKALPWYLFGYLTKKSYENRLSKTSNWLLILIFLFGQIITISVVLLNTKINYYYLGVLLTAPSLFLFAIKNPKIRLCNFIQYLGDTLSIYIYIFHPLVGSIFSFVIKRIGLNRTLIFECFYPIIVLITTVIISFIFDKFSKKTGFEKILR